MADLNTQLVFGANTAGAEAGVRTVKRSLKELGESAKKASQEAGAGIEAIGAGGDKAARDVERATKNIQGQLQRAIASFEAGEKGSRQFYESLARQRGADVSTLKPLLDQLDAYKTKADGAAQASSKFATAFSGLGTAATVAGRAFAAIGLGLSAGEFIRLADASTNVASRLGLVTSSAAELAAVQQRLFTISQNSRVSFVDLVGTYSQVARSTKDLGVSQTALLGVIQTISQAVTISGGSAASAQAALTQLSQGFAAGALRGEELNSMLEQTPRLAQALADGLGVGVGKLREMGQAGELTAERVLGALEKSAASVAAEFGKMAVTVEQASTNAANSVLKLVGAFDKLFGVTSAIAGAIQTVSSGVDYLSKDLEKLGSQGALRDAGREVINLDAAAQRLRNGMASGVLGPNAQGELDRINARLAEAKQRFRELDQQLGGGKDPRDQSGYTGRGTSYANEAARQAKFREDANTFRLKQSGVPDGYLKDMAELIRLNQAGVLVGKEYTDALKKQQDVLLQKSGVTKGSAAAANSEQSAYESLIASIRTKIEEDRLELAGGAALTESQRMRIKLDQDLLAGRVKLGSQQEAIVRQAIDEKAALEAQVAARNTLNKANLEAAQTREKYLNSLEAGIEKIKADIAAQDEATARMGLSKQAIADLDAAKLEMLATDLELQAIKALDRNLDQQTYDSLKEQARLYRDLAAAKKSGAAKEMALDLEKANEDAAKKAQQDWERAAEGINNSLTDALLRGFESGKDFAKNLRDTIVNMFKTLVLRPIISFIVNPIAGAITGALGLAGPAAAAGTSGVSGLGILGSLGGAFGGGVSAGFGGVLGSLGLSATGTTFGGALSAGSIALGSGNILGGLGTFAGALGPLVLGIGALTALLGSFSGETRTGGQFGVAFDGSVTNNRRGQTYTYQGQQYDRDFSDGRRDALVNGQAYRLEGDPVEQESAIRDAVSGTAKGIDAFLEALGSKARLSGFSAGLETSGKGRGGVFAGGTFEDGTTFGESGKGDNYEGTLYEKFSTNSPDFKQALADFTLDLKQSTIQALQSVTDIPETVKEMLKNVNAEGLSEEAANKILETINAQIIGVNQLTTAFDSMGMDELAQMGFDAAAGLAEAAGGFDKLLSSLNTFYTNFYTPEEQRANVERDLREQLSGVGLTLPDINSTDARAQYRAMVEAASKDMSEEGRKTYAILLALSGAFASITTTAESAAEALRKQQEEARNAAFSALERAVAAERKVLQSQLDTAKEVASTLGGLFDLLHDNVRELYGEVDSTRAMQAVQGNEFISQALAAAIKTGYLPDEDKLAEAIGAARGGLADVQSFGGDRAERDYAALVLAGKLSGLEKITEKQLTDAQRTVKALEFQIDQNEETLDYWKQQIEIANGTYEATVSVAKAISDLKVLLGGAPDTTGIGSGGSGGGGTSPTGGSSQGRVSYGADEALTSFEKFKAWYQGLRNTADPNLFKDGNYKVPDWMRVSGLAQDGSNEELFEQFQFFSNNRQYASDFEKIYTTGRSGYATDGSTLVKSDLTKMPPEVAEYFRANRDELLSYEGMGMDPVLAYKLYKDGPEQFGLDRKQQNFTDWLRSNKWTAGGIVANDNVAEYAAASYADYRQNKYDSATGQIVGMDGNLYTLDGKLVGPASQQQLDSAYGPGFKPLAGGRSSLYNSQVGNGDPTGYYGAIRTNLDKAIKEGKSAQWIADAIGTTGASMQDVAKAYGISVTQLRENLRANGATRIPQFAVGTNYVPRDMLAVIHEGEAVVPKAYNPAAGGGAAGSSRLEALVSELLAKVSALESAANATADNTGVTAGVLRSVSNNNSLYTSAPPAVFG